KGGFATKNAWGPGQGWIQASQGSKDSAAKGRRNETAQVIFELVEVVTAVACKQLIGAVATQGHGDLLAGNAGNIVGGNGGGVGKRLIVVPGQLVHNFEGLRADGALMMLRLKLGGDPTGEWGFVELLLFKADGASG